jgi:mercuric ion transport protein
MSKTAQPADAKASGDARHLGLLSQAGLVAAIAALAGASCCALPLTLAWVGLAGAWIANLEILFVYRPYITTVALVVIGLGWAIAVRRRASPRTLVVLGLASALVGAAVLVTHYEAELTRYLIALRRK